MVNIKCSSWINVLQHKTVADANVIQVRWAHPTFGTFGYLSLLCCLCIGIILGIVGFVVSLFGIEAEVWLGIWKFQGIAAGAVGILAAPVLFTMLSTFATMLFPLFRLGLMASKGIKLCFRAECDEHLHFSRLQLGSHIKLCALFGFLAALFPLVFILPGIGRCEDTSVIMVPGLCSVSLVSDGAAQFILALLAAPFLYSVYSAVIGVFAFIPFRFFTRMSAGAVLPSNEVRVGGEAMGPEKSSTRHIVWYAMLLTLCATVLLLCTAISLFDSLGSTVFDWTEIDDPSDEQREIQTADSLAPSGKSSPASERESARGKP